MAQNIQQVIDVKADIQTSSWSVKATPRILRIGSFLKIQKLGLS
jgi:hypothetical protein